MNEGCLVGSVRTYVHTARADGGSGVRGALTAFEHRFLVMVLRAHEEEGKGKTGKTGNWHGLTHVAPLRQASVESYLSLSYSSVPFRTVPYRTGLHADWLLLRRVLDAHVQA